MFRFNSYRINKSNILCIRNWFILKTLINLSKCFEEIWSINEKSNDSMPRTDTEYIY